MAQQIDIHPVRFNCGIPCGFRDSGWRQKVQHGDTTQFQMLLDVCPSEMDMITNGSFGAATGWTIVGDIAINTIQGFAEKTAGGIFSTISQLVPVANDVLLQITFDIELISGGVLMQVGNELRAITTSGIHVEYFVADTVNSIGFGAMPTAEFKLKSVQLYAMNTNFVVNVTTPDGTIVRSLDPVAFPQYFNFTGGFFTFTFDWTDVAGDYLPDDCYQLRVSDPCDCGNGGFVAMDFITFKNQFVLDPSWLVLGGSATFSGATSGDRLTKQNVVCGGLTYRLTYTLSNMAGNEFRIRLGAQLGVLRTTNGTFTELITSVGTNLLDMIFYGYNIGAPSSFDVTDFSIERADRSFDFVSNLFDFRTVVDCSVLVSACCDQNALLSGYGDTGFSPSVRLVSRYGQGSYRSTFNDLESSFGARSNYYFRGRKLRNFSFAAPEYIHDFTSNLKGYDHVFFDGVEIFMEDDEYPTPSYIENFDYAEIDLLVSIKVELIEKRKCNGSIKSCAIDGGGVDIIIDGGANDNAPLSTDTAEILTTDG